MRKNLTEIVFILDRSGSMSGLETDTIGGFNSMIEKQKKETNQKVNEIKKEIENSENAQKQVRDNMADVLDKLED